MTAKKSAKTVAKAIPRSQKPTPKANQSQLVGKCNTSFIDTPVNAGYNYTYQVISKNATQSAASTTTTKYVSCFWFFCGVQ